jgi:hypothetical protein
MELGFVRLGSLVAAGIAVLAAIVATPQLVENQDAGELMVIQSLSGELNCYSEPGPQWQGLGKVTTYPRRASYDFLAKDAGKKLRFNDGGHADLYGSVNWQMPTDCKSVLAIHREFQGPEGVSNKAVAQMVDTAIYLSGPLMSSTESSGERRSELVQLINDQAQNGPYQMRARTVETVDPVTKEVKTSTVSEIARDAAGLPLRQQGSILAQFGIKLLPLSIKELPYSSVVEAQIAQRQAATTQVQIAQAQARKAVQDAITAEENGKAAAAKAKWEQETVKAKEVTLAQQKLEVAALAAKEAEQFKREQILRGEGEAERRKLVMSADGALDAKLATYERVQANWATAFSKFPGGLVPQVQIGAGQSSTSAGNAQTLVDLLTAKTARDLQLDASPGQGAKK